MTHSTECFIYLNKKFNISYTNIKIILLIYARKIRNRKQVIYKLAENIKIVNK